MQTDKRFSEEMAEFPCTFHLGFKHVNKNRITERRIRLELEINNSKFEIRKINLLLWVYNELGKNKKALNLIEHYNHEFRTCTSITSLANIAYIMWNNGDELKATSYLRKLKELKSSPIYPSLLLETQAEMAFSYKKIGGILNLSRAIELYSKVVEAKPEDMNMKLELGITYRRTTHPRISKTEYLKNDPLICRVQKTADLLFTVANSNVDNKIRSRAYVEMAVMRRHTQRVIDIREYQTICRGMSIRKLCLEALKICEDDSRVLCECGRILHEFDWNSAIEVLEKSVQMMPHTVAYHHLAIAYGKRAKRLATDSKGNRWKSISQEPKNYLIDHTHRDAQKAIECYKEALNISHGENICALFNYGEFLKSCGQLDDAIVQFTKIIKSMNSSMEAEDPSQREHGQHRNIISAYEQIGLCYIAKYKKATGHCDTSEIFLFDAESSDDFDTDGYNCEGVGFNEHDLTSDQLLWKDKAEKILMQAVSLAARYSKEAPHAIEINVWKSYAHLEKKYSKSNSSKLVELLMLCGKHGDIFQIVEDLKNHDTEKLKQPTLFTGALKSYLVLRKYELALAFMNLLLPYVVGIDDKDLQTLQIQVHLCAAASRFEHPEECPGDLFQHVLDLQFRGKCPKVTLQKPDSCGLLNNCVVEQISYLDVLILYDESKPRDGSILDTSTRAVQLKKFIKKTYKLSVKCNKERNPVGLPVYPEEMLFFKTIVILLDDEYESMNHSLFNAHLKYIPLIAKECSERQRPVPTISLVLTSRFPESNIPLELKVYKYVYFEDIIQTQSTTPCKTEDRDRSSDEGLSPINNHVPSFKRNPLVNENVHSVGPEFSTHVISQMTCFCHLLLNREWPSCHLRQNKV